MVQIENMTKRYILGDEVWSLENIDLDIQSGSFTTFTGMSGSGKSTLMHLIGGLDTPDCGKIIVDGKEITGLNDKELSNYRNRTTGFVFQNFYLYPDINIVENVAIPLMLSGLSKHERTLRAKDALRSVGLEGLERHATAQISGGQRQRVAVARAIVNKPKLLLADEPTGNLDSHTGKMIMDLLLDLQRESRMTLIMVTHDERIARISDNNIEIQDGKIVSRLCS